MTQQTQAKRAKSRSTQQRRPAKKRISTGRVATGKAKRQRHNLRRRRQLEAAVARLDPQVAVRDFSQRMVQGSQGLFGSGWHPSKLVSLLLLALVIAGLYWVHSVEEFFLYREDVVFDNLTYLDDDELYGPTGIDGWSVFWVQAENVRQALRRYPYVADAQVRIQLPARVHIAVEEVHPTALWVTDEETLWLLADGTALPMRYAPTNDLLQIVDGSQAARDVRRPTAAAMDPAVLESALTLAAQFPALRSLNYNPGIGLNFALPGGDTWIYWGDGRDPAEKHQNLAAIMNVLQKEGRTTPIIDLRYPDRPYFQ